MRAVGYFREAPARARRIGRQNRRFLDFCEAQGYEVATTFTEERRAPTAPLRTAPRIPEDAREGLHHRRRAVTGGAGRRPGDRGGALPADRAPRRQRPLHGRRRRQQRRRTRRDRAQLVRGPRRRLAREDARRPAQEGRARRSLGPAAVRLPRGPAQPPRGRRRRGGGRALHLPPLPARGPRHPPDRAPSQRRGPAHAPQPAVEHGQHPRHPAEPRLPRHVPAPRHDRARHPPGPRLARRLPPRAGTPGGSAHQLLAAQGQRFPAVRPRGLRLRAATA